MFASMCAPLALVIVGLFLRSIQAYVLGNAPIQWARSPAHRIARPRVLALQGFARHFTPPQKLTLRDSLDSMFLSTTPLFSVKADQTIVWHGTDWCIEADQTNHNVRVNLCTGGPSQRWNWIPDSHGRNMIQLKDSNLCLHIDQEGNLNEVPIVLRVCGDATQSWKFEAPDSLPTLSPLKGHVLASDIRHVMPSLYALVVLGGLGLSAWSWSWWRHIKTRPVALTQGSMPGRTEQVVVESIVRRSMPTMSVSIEDVRLQPVDPEALPLPRPDYFDHRYKLPQHRTRLLERKNPHVRDERIVFHPKFHTYIVDGFPVEASVTGLVGEYQSDFNPNAAINAMKTSTKSAWPRLDYVLHPRRISHVDEFDASNFGCMIVDPATNTTVAVIEKGTDASGVTALNILRDQIGGILSLVKEPEESDEHWYIFERTMTDDEIKTKWKVGGEDARNRGTEAHLQMELWFNSEPVRHEDEEVKVGLAFVERSLVPIGAKVFRTEWTIFGEEENVAGTVDLAVILPNGMLYLIDWKRSEKLSAKMTGYSKMKAPLNHLEDCSGCAYALQLSSYQYLIEKYYGFKVAGLAVASIHPTKPFVTAVPFLKEEAEFVMNRRKALADARRALTLVPEHECLVCNRDGRFVMDAVRDKVGDLYDAKTARLHKISAARDPETTRAARAFLENRAGVTVYNGPAIPWKMRFPQPTDDLMAFSAPPPSPPSPRKATLLGDDVVELSGELDAPIGAQGRGKRSGLPPAWLVDVSTVDFHQLHREGNLSKLTVKELKSYLFRKDEHLAGVKAELVKRVEQVLSKEEGEF